MKFQKDGLIVEVSDPNTYNLFERNGFEPVVATEEAQEVDPELEELRAKAKELGIRNAHSMGKEKLLAKIAEVEE